MLLSSSVSSDQLPYLSEPFHVSEHLPPQLTLRAGRGTGSQSPGLRSVPERGDAGEVWSSGTTVLNRGSRNQEHWLPVHMVDCGLGGHCCF